MLSWELVADCGGEVGEHIERLILADETEATIAVLVVEDLDDGSVEETAAVSICG